MHRLTSLALLLASSAALAVPLEFTHQGRLMDSGGLALTGDHDLQFLLYDAPATGTMLWSETHVDLPFDNGFYSAPLGSVTALDAATFDADELYLALAIDGGGELPTRIPLVSVPFAIRALNVSGGVVDASEIRIDGTTVIDSTGSVSASWTDLSDVPADFADDTDDDTLAALQGACTAGQITAWDGTDWQCIDNTHDANAIVGGTLDVARLPVGDDSTSVAAGDHTHPFTEVTGIATAAQIPDLDAGKITGGTLAFGRLPVGTGAGTVSEGNHTHAIAELPPRDALGITYIDDVIMTRDAFTDGTVTWRGAAEVHNAQTGWADVGANFTQGGEYMRFPVVAAGVLDDLNTYKIEVEWVRECRTADCDTITRLLDGAGNEVRLATYDNNGGRINPSDSGSFAEDWQLGGQGTPEHVTAVWTVGGGNPSTLDWQTHYEGAHDFADREQLTTVMEPSTGIDYYVTHGDNTEGYRERFVRVRIRRID